MTHPLGDQDIHYHGGCDCDDCQQTARARWRHLVHSMMDLVDNATGFLGLIEPLYQKLVDQEIPAGTESTESPPLDPDEVLQWIKSHFDEGPDGSLIRKVD